MSLAYLNGEFLPLEQAKVSALDRGFLFGDAAYEVIPFYQGRGVGLPQHLIRLEQSLAALSIPLPVAFDEWLTICHQILASHPDGDYKIYIEVTRGAAHHRDFVFPDSATVKPTVFAFAAPFVRGNSAKGMHTITYEDIRWRDVYIKSNNLLPSCLATEKAKQHDAQEAIFHRDDLVTEGASSNIFVVKNNCVYTAPANGRILNGITRQLILPLLEQLQIKFEERAASLTELRTADEIWVTSSTREIAPVIMLDGKPVAEGKPGALWNKVYPEYTKLIETTPKLSELVTKAEALKFKFPCSYPIKIMGKTGPELLTAITDILKTHIPDFDPTTLTSRESKDKNFQAVTATITAQSKAQLDTIYSALTSNKLIMVVL